LQWLLQFAEEIDSLSGPIKDMKKNGTCCFSSLLLNIALLNRYMMESFTRRAFSDLPTLQHSLRKQPRGQGELRKQRWSRADHWPHFKEGINQAY